MAVKPYFTIGVLPQLEPGSLSFRLDQFGKRVIGVASTFPNPNAWRRSARWHEFTGFDPTTQIDANSMGDVHRRIDTMHMALMP